MMMEIDLEPTRGAAPNRFEALLSGASEAAYDQPLIEFDDWLVAPTLGAIIPGWLLAIPKLRVLSIRDWNALGGPGTGAVLRTIQEQLGLTPDEIIWFEHGPAVQSSPVGCGLDHAHLHVLLRPRFDFSAFLSVAVAQADLVWREVPAEQVYSSLPVSGSYLAAGNAARGLVATEIEAVGSQFFRRVVATLMGEERAWDYRRYPHIENIDATIASFRQLERA